MKREIDKIILLFTKNITIRYGLSPQLSCNAAGWEKELLPLTWLKLLRTYSGTVTSIFFIFLFFHFLNFLSFYDFCLLVTYLYLDVRLFDYILNMI